jgi:Na+/proline symporter
MGCTFLAPTVLGLYWRKATRAGALAAQISGFGAVLLLYILGWLGVGKPAAAELAGTFLSATASADALGSISFSAAAQEHGHLGPQAERFAPYYLFDLDPLIYGLGLSFFLGIVVSLFTQPLPKSHVDRYFLASHRSP